MAKFYFHGKDYQNSGKNLVYAITSGGIRHLAFDPSERFPRPSYFGEQYSKIVLFQRFDFSSTDRQFHQYNFELEDIGLSKKIEYLDSHSFWAHWHFFTHFKCIVLFVVDKNRYVGGSIRIYQSILNDEDSKKKSAILFELPYPDKLDHLFGF